MKANNISQPQRKQTSVVLEGIDTSTPNDIVKDGKCETLLNLRFKDNAWRPVGEYDIKGTINGSNIDIVYHHPAAGEKSYIIHYIEGGKHCYSLVTLGEDNTFSVAGGNKGNLIDSFDEEMKISHFGNVLFFTCQNNIESYILKNNIYLRNSKPTPPVVSVWKSNEVDSGVYWHILPTDCSTSGFQPDDFTSKSYLETPSKYWRWLLFSDSNPVMRVDRERTNRSFVYWWGEIAFFVCYRMEDGTTLGNSPLAIIASETELDNMNDKEWKYDIWWKEHYTSRTGVEYKEQYVYAYKTNDEGTVIDSDYAYHPQLIAIAPTITINTPTDLVGVTSCAIYSTRINPIFTSKAEDSIFSNNKLAEQPFYLIKEIPLSDFDNGAYSFVLDYNILQDAESKPVYTPLNNIHTYIPNITLDYNQRLHIANYDTKLFEGFDYDSICVGESSVENTSYIQLDIDNNKHWVSPGTSNHEKFKEGFNRIISYPDYRATQYAMYSYGKQTTDIGATLLINITATYEMKSSIGNNIAYYTAPSQPLLKYPSIKFGGRHLGYINPIVQSTVRQSNKIMVSSLNNPFSWPFENTYAIGSESSKILALQSAAIEMSDAKFGEMPLYAFTEEGIFALQAGENTLYSSVIPINYDKIINPDVLAINYSVAYITEKGLHLLNNQGNTLISSPLNTIDGKPLDAWKSIKLLNPQSFNEIICYDENTATAYIYNLDYQYWSTRKMSGHVINNTESVSDGNIYDISHENLDKPSQWLLFITRPIKLGDLDFKRLETIIPRISGNGNIAFVVEASNDCKEWMTLRYFSTSTIPKPITLRRTPFSAKYFRFQFLSDFSNGHIALTNIDLEWYHKFLRRMR